MKNFDNWNTLKKEIEKKPKAPLFREGEIWWSHFGLNVGYELDGKNNSYERPVYVFSKHNENHFLGVALTSSENENAWRLSVAHSEKTLTFNFSQMKTMSAKRLIRRMAKLSEDNRKVVKNEFALLYIKDERPSFEGLSQAPMAK